MGLQKSITDGKSYIISITAQKVSSKGLLPSFDKILNHFAALKEQISVDLGRAVFSNTDINVFLMRLQFSCVQCCNWGSSHCKGCGSCYRWH